MTASRDGRPGLAGDAHPATRLHRADSAEDESPARVPQFAGTRAARERCLCWSAGYGLPRGAECVGTRPVAGCLRCRRGVDDVVMYVRTTPLSGQRRRRHLRAGRVGRGSQAYRAMDLLVDTDVEGGCSRRCSLPRRTCSTLRSTCCCSTRPRHILRTRRRRPPRWGAPLRAFQGPPRRSAAGRDRPGRHPGGHPRTRVGLAGQHQRPHRAT